MKIEDVNETILHLCPDIKNVAMHLASDDEYYLVVCENTAGQLFRIGIYYKLSTDPEALHNWIMHVCETINEGDPNARN